MESFQTLYLDTFISHTYFYITHILLYHTHTFISHIYFYVTHILMYHTHTFISHTYFYITHILLYHTHTFISHIYFYVTHILMYHTHTFISHTYFYITHTFTPHYVWYKSIFYSTQILFLVPNPLLNFYKLSNQHDHRIFNLPKLIFFSPQANFRQRH